jgi:hypothetical protein
MIAQAALDHRVRFVHAAVEYSVLCHNGRYLWRESKHFGGVWQDASKTIINKSISWSFRQLLINAMAKVTEDISAKSE